MKSSSKYFESRKDLKYYKKIQEILRELSFSSIIDIGSRKSPVFETLNKDIYAISLDKDLVYEDKDNFICADFNTWIPNRKYDVVLCLQVLEHLDDPFKFTQKLFDTGNIIIISVPYKWKKGLCKEHVQDPVDETLIKQWTMRMPSQQFIIKENNNVERIICCYFPN